MGSLWLNVVCILYVVKIALLATGQSEYLSGASEVNLRGVNLPVQAPTNYEQCIHLLWYCNLIRNASGNVQHEHTKDRMS